MKPPLKIQRMAVRAVAAPMKRPLAASTGAISVAPLLLIDLQTDGGVIGRSYLFGIARQNLKPLAALVEAMAEMLQGDPVLPFEIEAKLRKRHTLLGVGRAGAGDAAAARAAARRGAAPGARL
jgi:mandelate racemase